MTAAWTLTLLCSGAFLLVGLLTGVWKYVCIARSPDATAPVYVDVAHRASLMYAFASLVLLQFVELSPYCETWTLVFAAAPQLFFALAIGTYVIHGVLRDTDNQLRRPHRLGKGTVPGWATTAFMVSLIVAEVGGAAALVGGVAWSVLRGG